MTFTPTRLVLGLAAVIGLAACGSDGSTEATTTEPVPAAATAAPASPTGKVSANDATEDELIAVMEAAGIDNAAKWADEIIEYRPYAADDTSLETLSGELAKYNASPETIDQILALLEL